jgi:hypothetical protein
MNGYNYSRPHKFASLIGPFLIMFNLMHMILPDSGESEEYLF